MNFVNNESATIAGRSRVVKASKSTNGHYQNRKCARANERKTDACVSITRRTIYHNFMALSFFTVTAKPARASGAKGAKIKSIVHKFNVYFGRVPFRRAPPPYRHLAPPDRTLDTCALVSPEYQRPLRCAGSERLSENSDDPLSSVIPQPPLSPPPTIHSCLPQISFCDSIFIPKKSAYA
ncbi:hypothetical protein EVAR_75682_1 [Eumeta japonica]|uniref:Uncharacterized protein n=1 Tax=Eumeta variegata TaxID=151549 RepID=A0A4C1W3R9_EUMVA|nr:hypothetical protein EVAR_75682_1 [Eumeta japonica]